MAENNHRFLFSPTTVQHPISFARAIPTPHKTVSPGTPSSSSLSSSSNMSSTTASSAPVAAAKKPLDISSLMSPPELPPFETFTQSALSATPGTMRHTSIDERFAPNPPLSPPISPFTRSTNCIDPIPTVRDGSQDPILYPARDASPLPPQQPLFKAVPETAVVDPRRVVDEHVAARPTSLFREASPPNRDDYELALCFKSAVMKRFAENPRGWLRKERALLLADQQASTMAKKRFQPILPAKVRQPVAARVSKPKALLPTYKPVVAARPVKPSPGPGQISRAGPMGTTARQFVRRESATQKKSSLTPEPRAKVVGPNREDKDFVTLPDYCPPTDSLPNKPNCLKVDWKGNALDLGQDPHRHLLHPDEILLAAGLRLDCATYLTSKRRIFMRRLECARINKEFRKTDAQQACKIDVNKASKLWTAYDKVGWLKPHWMQRHM